MHFIKPRITSITRIILSTINCLSTINSQLTLNYQLSTLNYNMLIQANDLLVC